MTTTQEKTKFDFPKMVVIFATFVGAGTGVIAIWLLTTVFIGGEFPFVSNDYSAFIALTIIGFTMCSITFPIRATMQKGFKWLSIFTISSIVLGVLISVFAGLIIAKIQIPLITERIAIIILSVLILVKFIIATTHLFIKI